MVWRYSHPRLPHSVSASKGHPGLRVVEQIVDELSGCLVGFGGSSGVDVKSHRWAGMAEPSGDGTHVGAVRDEMCSRRMAEIMKSDAVEPMGVGEGSPVMSDLVERQRMDPVP